MVIWKMERTMTSVKEMTVTSLIIRLFSMWCCYHMNLEYLNGMYVWKLAAIVGNHGHHEDKDTNKVLNKRRMLSLAISMACCFQGNDKLILASQTQWRQFPALPTLLCIVELSLYLCAVPRGYLSSTSIFFWNAGYTLVDTGVDDRISMSDVLSFFTYAMAEHIITISESVFSGSFLSVILASLHTGNMNFITPSGQL